MNASQSLEERQCFLDFPLTGPITARFIDHLHAIVLITGAQQRIFAGSTLPIIFEFPCLAVMRGALQFDFFLFVMRITSSVAVGAGLTASTRADPASATLVTERPALVEEIVVFFFVDFSEVVPFFL